MVYSYSKNIPSILVSALALTFCLQSLPASAMDVETSNGGNISDYLTLAKGYHRGLNGQPVDFVKAEEYYLKAVKYGDAAAKDSLTWFYGDVASAYQYGKGGKPVNLEKAEEYYLKAVKYGDAVAKDSLTRFYKDVAYGYHYGRSGLTKDFAKAKEYYLKAIEYGDPQAKARLATLYYDMADGYHYGRSGLTKDFAKAEEYYAKAIEKGAPQAKARLATLYYDMAYGYHYGRSGLTKDFAEAKAYYLKALDDGAPYAKAGLATLYFDMADGYHFEREGFSKDFAEAKKYYLKAIDNGDPQAKAGLAQLYCDVADGYHYGRSGLTKDFAEAKAYYQKALDDGAPHAKAGLAQLYSDIAHGYYVMADGYHFEREGFSKDFAEAKKYYLKAIENGDPHAKAGLERLYSDIAHGHYVMAYGYHYGQGDVTQDFAKAEEYYLKAVTGGCASAYAPLASLAHDRKESSKAVYWAIKAKDAKYDHTIPTLLKDYMLPPPAENAIETVTLVSIDEDEETLLKAYMFPPPAENAVEAVTFVSLDEEEAKEIMTQWTATATPWLTRLMGNMCGKVGACSQEGKMTTNSRRHKPNAKDHYASFGAILEKANTCLSQVLNDNSFSFLIPKTSVQNYLVAQKFDLYNPCIPTSSECVGLRLYNIGSYQHMIAFGNESVKRADEVAGVLTGLGQLADHHRGKKDYLQRLRDYKQQKTALPKDMQQLELDILQKPSHSFVFDIEAQSMPSFKKYLVSKIKVTCNDMPDDVIERRIDHRILSTAMGMLKTADEVSSKDQWIAKLKTVCFSVPEETITLFVDNKMEGVATNPTFDQCIDRELIERINQKIKKRKDKVELLEGITDTFKQMLIVKHPQKVKKFKETYPDLSDMFD